MTEAAFAAAPGRAVLRVAGADRVIFLQGLVSNDVALVSPQHAIWAALLTPQGRYLHDFFIAEADGAFLVDAEAEKLPDLLRRLKMYKLRAQVTIDPAPELAVFLVWGEDSFELPERGAAASFGGVTIIRDPRLAGLGLRLIGPEAEVRALLAARDIAPGDWRAWDVARIELGVPDGSRDLFSDRALLLENGFDELAGVSWTKGCYVGQELTARTKYRGLVKKRLIPVAIDGAPPAPGTIFLRDGQELGEMRSSTGQHGLALLRLDALGTGQIPTEGGSLKPVKPDWWRQGA